MKTKATKANQENGWWEELPDSVKSSIEKGLKQSKRGETLDHFEIMNKYKKWLKK